MKKEKRIQNFQKFYFFLREEQSQVRLTTELVLLLPRLLLLISMKQFQSLEKLLTLMQKFCSLNIQKIYSQTIGQKLQKNLILLQTLTIREY